MLVQGRVQGWASAVSVFSTVIAVMWLASVPAADQATTAKPRAAAEGKKWTLPRTSWGDPDLQGMWNNTAANAVPLEAQDEAILRERQRQREARSGAGVPTTGPPDHWGEGARAGAAGVALTHLLVDPPDGKLPPLTPEAQKRWVARSEARQGSGADEPTPGGWVEDLHVWVRCITRGLPDAMFPRLYNNNYQIVQTPEYVAILYEMIHDARIIPLDGRPHLPQNVRQWLGDPRGHWEGDTLVVDTTNFRGYEFNLIPHGGGGYGSYLGAGGTLHLVERFTRIDAETIEYRFTVDDPMLYTRPWTGVIPLTTKGSPEQTLEYACHEGNYGIVNILTAARAKDRAAQEAGKVKR
jgi:hypothetical protein